jgi:hypothetical protein
MAYQWQQQLTAGVAGKHAATARDGKSLPQSQQWHVPRVAWGRCSHR